MSCIPARTARERPFPIAVLVSGRGSNLGALIDAGSSGALPIEIVLVASDRAEALALRRAENAGIATLALDPRGYAGRAQYDAELFRRIAEHEPALVVLAGFMRILDPGVLAPWVGRVINIHPSLLPKYRGLRTHARALAAGDDEHGASVHFVTAELDGGPVIAQARLPIEAADTPETLAARVLLEEHRLLIASIRAFASGRIGFAKDRVLHNGRPLAAPLVLDAQGRLAATA